MARPNKQGVDYFPLDVHLDSKFKFIEMKHRLEGFAIIIKIYQRIYSVGYYCNWSKDEQMLFADEHKVDPTHLEEVVKEALDRDLFNEELFIEFEILTSKGIQKRYQDIVSRRKNVEIIENYLLIPGPFGVNVNTMSTPCTQDDVKSTQSKVNKSKVNKSKCESEVSELMNTHIKIDHLSITREDHKKLVDEYGQEAVENIYQRIGNYADNKKYKSLYLTANQWLKNDTPNNKAVTIGQAPQIPEGYFPEDWD